MSEQSSGVPPYTSNIPPRYIRGRGRAADPMQMHGTYRATHPGGMNIGRTTGPQSVIAMHQRVGLQLPTAITGHEGRQILLQQPPPSQHVLLPSPSPQVLGQAGMRYLPPPISPQVQVVPNPNPELTSPPPSSMSEQSGGVPPYPNSIPPRYIRGRGRWRPAHPMQMRGTYRATHPGGMNIGHTTGPQNVIAMHQRVGLQPPTAITGHEGRQILLQQPPPSQHVILPSPNPQVLGQAGMRYLPLQMFSQVQANFTGGNQLPPAYTGIGNTATTTRTVAPRVKKPIRIVNPDTGTEVLLTENPAPAPAQALPLSSMPTPVPVGPSSSEMSVNSVTSRVPEDFKKKVLNPTQQNHEDAADPNQQQPPAPPLFQVPPPPPRSIIRYPDSLKSDIQADVYKVVIGESRPILAVSLSSSETSVNSGTSGVQDLNTMRSHEMTTPPSGTSMPNMAAMTTRMMSHNQKDKTISPTNTDDEHMKRLEKVAQALLSTDSEEEETPIQGLTVKPLPSTITAVPITIASASSHSLLSPGPPEHLMVAAEDHNKWLYRDPQGKLQGPFQAKDMKHWLDEGYFTTDLMVKRVCDSTMLPLGQFIHLWGGNPFIPGYQPPPINPTNPFWQQIFQQQQDNMSKETAPTGESSAETATGTASSQDGEGSTQTDVPAAAKLEEKTPEVVTSEKKESKPEEPSRDEPTVEETAQEPHVPETMKEQDLDVVEPQTAEPILEADPREEQVQAMPETEAAEITMLAADSSPVVEVEKQPEPDGDLEKYLAACEEAMRKKGKLDQTIIPCVFVGPPGNGKTSLMRRLIGKLPLPSDEPLPSTGVAEKVVQVDIRRSSSTAAQMIQNTSVWKELTLDDEAVALLMDISRDQTLESHSNTPSPPSDSPTANASITTKSESHFQFDAEATVPPSSFIPPLEMFKDILRTKGWSAAHEYLEGACIAYLTDTGGQLEFQELLPALVSGPSVFFLVFRLDQDLNQRFTVEYRHPRKGCTKPYESSYTVIEFLLHTLASIASMGSYVYKGVQKKQVPLKPKVFFVGTHKDKVSKEEIEQIDCDLLQKIKHTDYYKSGIIEFGSEKHLIIPVNNLSPDDSDAQLVRCAVERIRDQGTFDVSAPPQWLIFSLVLRKLKESVVTYDECLVVAKQCGIDTLDELNDALGFLSAKVGLIRYFQGAHVDEDLQKIVIQDSQVLFDRITNLIMATFTFQNAAPARWKEFKEKGIFSRAIFAEISSREGKNLLTPSRLLKLLQHLHIIAPIQEMSDDVKYFIPCILAHAATVNPKLSVWSCPMANDSNAPTLLACFSCGYCPRGLFCALVVYLLNKSKSPWKLNECKGIFRNQISFSVGSYDYVSLTVSSTLKFIEVNCTPSQVTPRTSDFATVCREVRCAIESGVEAVASTLHYKYNPADLLKLGFYCPLKHPAQISFSGGDPLSLECSECKDPFQNLPSNYGVWFDETCGRKSSSAQFSLDLEVEPGHASATPFIVPIYPPVSQMKPAPPADAVNTPDLIQLLKFPGKTKDFSIAKEIGIRYKQFGIFLLNDGRGANVDAIAQEHNNVSEQINIEILQLWLGGEGRDVSWRTLIEVLKDIGLRELATEIADVKKVTMSA